MAITQPKQPAKAETFTDKAPDAKPTYRFKGKRRPIAMTLPPEIVDGMARVAARRDHSRAKIEIVLRESGPPPWCPACGSREAGAG